MYYFGLGIASGYSVIIQRNDNKRPALPEKEGNGETKRNGRKAIARGTRQLWKEPASAGHKLLSRTITIRAINLNLSPVTRIMRAARVSTSITFEIPQRTRSHPLIVPTRVTFFLFACLLSSVLSLRVQSVHYPINRSFYEQRDRDFALIQI